MSATLILVPARYGSTRFPGKPLAKIHGKTMISYVIENCRKSGLDFAIVTDDERIEKEVKSLSAPVVRVDDDVPTGSERIALAYARNYKDKGYQYIINVQGDEPLLTADAIKNLANFHTQNPRYAITTLVKERKTTESDFANPNVVKCVLSGNGQCLYFSRSPVPYNRSQEESLWYQHIGVYCYQAKALEDFVKLVPSHLEQAEKLEQLRALENQMIIGAQICNLKLIGVDAPEDIVKIEGVLRV